MTTESRAEPSRFEPRFPTLWAALTYAACTLSLAWPAVLGRFLVNERSDQYLAGFAFREFAAAFLKENGAFPLWNPYLQGGMPFVGAMHGDIFYPTFLLRLVMPVDVAMSWGMIAHFFLCGLATYWFLRVAARMSFGGALVGGLAYMMAGFVSSLLSAGHDGKLFVNALFPVILLVLTWWMRDGKGWAPGLLALVVGLTLLTPHPQLFQYAMIGAAAWALFLGFAPQDGSKPSARPTWIRLGIALGAVAVGVAIGAIQYLPAAEYKDWSPRAPGLDYAIATSYSFPIEELVNLYLPQFSGILDNYWGRNGIHFHSEYAGAVVLLLAGAAFGAATTDARRRFFRFWVGTAIVSLLWALGGSTPFYQLIYALVPMTKYFRAPSTIFFITAFAIAVFAGLGTERVLEGRVSRRYVMGWAIFGAVMAALAQLGVLTAIAHALVQIPPFADRVDAGVSDLKLGALRSLAFVLAGGGVVLAITTRRMQAWQGIVALAALAAFDLWTIERKYWGSVAPAAELYATDPTIEYLKAQAEPARVLALEDNSQPAAAHDAFLVGDALMTHRIRATFGYHGNEIGRYQLFRQQEMMFNPTMWAMTNTRFLLVNNDTLDIPGGTRVAGPARNAAGTTVSLYRLPGENPFAWVAPAIVKYPERETVDALRQPNFPVRSVALVDPASAVPAVDIRTIPQALATSVRTTRYAAGRIAVELSEPAPRGSALIVSENYYPGWQATVDGAPATVERMNLVLIGVPLPEGGRVVELTFTSAAYERGRLVTLLAIGLAIAATMLGVVRSRARGAAR